MITAVLVDAASANGRWWLWGIRVMVAVVGDTAVPGVYCAVPMKGRYGLLLGGMVFLERWLD